MKRILLLAALLGTDLLNLAGQQYASAQGGIAKVDDVLKTVNTGVRGMYPTIENIAAVMMAIVGVIAAIKVYSKWSAGDSDVRESAMQWFGAIIFASFVLVIVSKVFNPT